MSLNELMDEIENIKEKINTDEYVKISNLLKKNYEENKKNDFYEVTIYKFTNSTNSESISTEIINEISSFFIGCDDSNLILSKFKFVSRLNKDINEDFFKEGIVSMKYRDLRNFFLDFDILRYNDILFINKKNFQKYIDKEYLVSVEKL